MELEAPNREQEENDREDEMENKKHPESTRVAFAVLGRKMGREQPEKVVCMTTSSPIATNSNSISRSSWAFLFVILSKETSLS